MTLFSASLLFTFLAGLGFAPAVELGPKVRQAARFAVIATSGAAVAWVLFTVLRPG